MRSRSFVLSGLVAGAILLTSSPAFAQLQAGVQGGINIANVSFTAGDPSEGVPEFKSRTLGVFGAFIARDFNPKVGLQIDILYSQKGTKAEVTDGIDTFTFEASVDYLEIPILIRGNIPGSDKVKGRVFGGPSIGFKVRDDTKTTFNGVDVSGDEDAEFESTDFGLVIGGAVQFGKVFVDARYNWGLMNVVKDDGSGDEAKTRTFGIMVGYQFK